MYVNEGKSNKASMGLPVYVLCNHVFQARRGNHHRGAHLKRQKNTNDGALFAVVTEGDYERVVAFLPNIRSASQNRKSDIRRP